jgi:GTP cyclohydrolase I
MTTQHHIDPKLDAVRRLIKITGDDPDREGLRATPHRVIRAYYELFRGYDQDPNDLLKTFDAGTYEGMVLLRDIEVYSMCEHHMLPFVGKAHIAYIPNGRVIGVSKLARLVDLYARRLQIQERLTEQVTSALMEHLKPRGVACMIEAVHFCMRMRGCSKQSSTMVTDSLKGDFLEEGPARNEFLQLVTNARLATT